MHKTRITALTLLLTTALAIATIPMLVPTFAATDGWTLVTDSRPLKAYPDLKELVWQKNASMPPNGQYDKIGLHRLIKTGTAPKAVVLIIPGDTSNGEALASNPTTENFTKYETYSQAIYWANRGLDVYTMDFRKHFLPNNLPINASQLALMKDWGWDVWISDIKEAVGKVKEVSGARKVFMAGLSVGGLETVNYAAKYWKEDLRGLILLESAVNWTRISNPTNSYNLTKALDDATAGGNWYQESVTLSSRVTCQAALDNPGAPAPNITGFPPINPMTNKTWANVTEFLTFVFHYFPGYPTAGFSNLYGGYGNITQLLYAFANCDRFMPTRLSLESNAMDDWVNCPYFAYDYTEHYKEIDVPFITFVSGKAANSTGSFQFVEKPFATSDMTKIMLTNYGHYDVFYGRYAYRDVSQVALDWMLSRYQAPAASAFCDVTVLPGWTWYFFAHSNGGIGAHTYQWYEGTTLLQGQTSMVLPVTKTSPGTYTFICKVTDSEGTTANSNTVTLTVLG